MIAASLFAHWTVPQSIFAMVVGWGAAAAVAAVVVIRSRAAEQSTPTDAP